MSRYWFFVFGMFFLIGFLSFISADVISINSGGDSGLILNPQNLLEGFFSKVNRLPVASSLILSSSSSENTTNENLSISYSATDADGNFITNITDWRVDGNSIAVLNMPFDKNVAELTSGAVRDYSSYENNGTLGGGTKANAPTWNSSCQVGGCYVFDGVDDYAIHNQFSISKNDSWTFSMWHYKESNSGDSWQGFVGKNQATTDGGYWMWHPSLTWYQDYYDDGTGYDYYGYQGSSINLGDEAPYDEWFLLTIVYNGSNYQAKSYINGNLEETKTVTWSPRPISQFTFNQIGRGSSNRYFNGSIDEVLIFDRALSGEQIQEIYSAGLEGHQVEKMVSEETDKGDNWQVALTPNDKIMDGETIFSNTLGIIDSAPENPSSVTLVSVNGTDESDDDLNCSAYIEDVDNDLLDVEVEWYKDDVSVLSQSFSDWENGTTFYSVLDSGNLTLGDVWYCSVRTYDGNDYSNWVDSNTLEIVDITNPEVYIISPLSEDVYNYTSLNVTFNVSIVENENMSMCFYDLDDSGNVSMNELNDSYFYSEPSLGPGPHEVVFWCNDTSNNWGTNSTTFYIEDEAAISIDLSDELSWWVRWNLTYLPADDLGAIGNNGSGITEYWVNISATATTVDLYVKADGDLLTQDLDVLGLGNETFSYVVNDPYVNTTSNVTMQTSYINVGTALDDGDVVYLKFFIDAPSGQPAGVYQNQLSFKAVREGYPI